MKIAILVLSATGLDLARRVREGRGEETVIFGPSCVVGRCGGMPGAELIFDAEENGVRGWIGPLRKVFPKIWGEFDAIVGMMAMGIVVRLAGSLASDKRSDPAVVVVDEAGRFAVSVLGGHGAGANDLTRKIAAILGATPVITTASDARGLPAVDLIGRDLGWKIDRAENLTRVAASVARGETVAVWQDAGETDWWKPFGPWPGHFVRIATGDDLARVKPSALLIISDRVVTDDRIPADRTIVYRPPTLVAGIGCKRGTSREAIDAWVNAVFAANGLARESLAAVATVTLKADEPGLIAFANRRGVPLVAFAPEELDGQPGIETPSERVRSKIGIPAVAEPAALREAGAEILLVTKQKGPGITVALARKQSNPRNQEKEPKG